MFLVANEDEEDEEEEEEEEEGEDAARAEGETKKKKRKAAEDEQNACFFLLLSFWPPSLYFCLSLSLSLFVSVCVPSSCCVRFAGRNRIRRRHARQGV